MQGIARTVPILVAAALAVSAAQDRQAAPEFGAPDLLFFEQHVAAELHRRCSGCHCDPETAGHFRLAPLDDLDRPDRVLLLSNFRSTLAFLDPDRPDESPLLRKVVGAESHGGGQLFRNRAEPGFETILHFAMGATTRNRPPEAIVLKRYDTVLGADLELDGTLSGDPEGSELTFVWETLERPVGSDAAARPGDESGFARLEPDRTGVYRIELSVYDGGLWSVPASLMVVVGEAPAVPTEPPPETARPVKPAPGPKAFVERRLNRSRLRLIRRLFLDLRWRSPRLKEIEAWYPRSHADMVRAFLRHEETWAAWCERQLYYFLLLDRFRPKQGRLTTLPARLARGETSAPQAVEEIVRSQYFNARNPGNDTFVTVVLEQGLGLVVQERRNKRLLEAGKRMYDGYRAKLFGDQGSSQADFVRIACAQEAFYTRLLRRTWKDLHGSEADPERLRKDVERLRFDPKAYAAILEEWLNAPAYREGIRSARTKPPIPYVRSLFVDVLGRLPSYEELRNVRNAFLSLADPAPIRLVMGRVLLESKRAKIPASALVADRFVREQFVRLLARPATTRERTRFADALRFDPVVTPGVILWTLISSPEYQTY